MTWTQFMDMHSGGGQKLQWSHIYIEAPEAEARIIFRNAFGRDPENVTCNCCGEDYSSDESVSLEQASGYERGCRSLETPKLPDGRYDNENPVIKAHLWLEDGEEPPAGFRVNPDRPLLFRRTGYATIKEYIARPDVKVIPALEILADWRKAP